MTERPASGSGSEQDPRSQPDPSPESGPRPRGPRRAVRQGTKPSADESPDVAAGEPDAAPEEAEHDRWLREQRPPHWE